MYFLSANYLHTSRRRRTMEKILFVCSKINFYINRNYMALEFTANTYNFWKIFVKCIASFIWGKKDFTAKFAHTYFRWLTVRSPFKLKSKQNKNFQSMNIPCGLSMMEQAGTCQKYQITVFPHMVSPETIFLFGNCSQFK